MMKQLFIISALMAIIIAPAAADDQTVVLELFTSQGCVACPPADKILAVLAQDENVVALSWAVDYWDYLGWRDTFGSPENTKRQVDYNTRLGVRGVFTPQVIINGSDQTVGSRAEEIRDLIRTRREAGGLPVNVAVEGDWEELRYSIEQASDQMSEQSKPLVIRLVWYDADQIVKIGFGDNGGRELHYTNVVRGTKIIGEWNGEDMSGVIDLADMLAMGVNCVAIILQDGETGPILGAAKIVLAPIT